MESDLWDNPYRPHLAFLEPEYVKILENDEELRDKMFVMARSFQVNASPLIDVVEKSLAKTAREIIEKKYGKVIIKEKEEAETKSE